jgi:exodeoxyribonuclease VII large subunit
LSAFNEEVLARAIASSAVPVVAAVGHEIDLSIADLVADRRAATPTAAAEMVVPRWEDLRAQVETDYHALVLAMQHHIESSSKLVVHLRKRLRDPRQALAVHYDRLQTLTARLSTAFRHQHERGQARVQELTATLNSLSPLAVLGRGYSLTRTMPDGKVVRDADSLTPGDLVRLTFATGEARARIEEVNT